MSKVIAWMKGHVLLTVVIAVVAFCGIGSIGALMEEPASDSKDKASESSKDQGDGDEESEQKKAAEAEPEPKKPVDQLEGAVEDTDVEVETVELNKAGIALVEFKVQDNLTSGLMRTGIAKDVFAIAEAADKSGVKIKEISFRGLFPLVDKYGDEEDGQVFYTTFLGSDLPKIDYDDVLVTQYENIANLAIDGIVVLHPDMQD